MQPNKYSTHFAELSNLILSMPEEQQAKLVDLATRIQKVKSPFANNGRDNTIVFTSGILAGWGLVTILFLILAVI